MSEIRPLCSVATSSPESTQAVAASLAGLARAGDLLVLCGDVPLIDPEELARMLGSKLATACATGELEGIKNVGKREVVAQGNAVEKVARILAEWYGVPSRFIDTADKLKGKGKNK